MIRIQNKLDKLENSAITFFYFLLRSSLSFGIGYITAKCNIFADFSPFSLILLSISPKIGLVPTFCFLGSALGHLSNPFQLSVFKYITALTMIYIIYMIFQKSMHIIKNDSAILAAGCCLGAGILFMLVEGFALYSVLLLICECVLICCCIYFVNYAAEAFKKCCFLSSRELIAASVTLILILISLQHITVFQLNVTRMLMFALLFLAFSCLKTSHTAVLGCCLGIISAAIGNGGEAIFTAMIVGTLLGCVFSSFSEKLAVTSFGIGYFAVLFFFGKFPWNYWYFAEPPIAMAAVFFVPKKQLKEFLSSYIAVRSSEEEPIKKNQTENMDQLIEEFSSLSKKIENKMTQGSAELQFYFEEEKTIKAALEKRNLNVMDLNFIKDQNHCKKCEIIIDKQEDLQVENILSDTITPYFKDGCSVKIVEQKSSILAIFKEKSAFTISCAALCRNKQNETVSGDHTCGFYIDKNSYCILLADGMGCGENAGHESKLAVDTLQKLLQSGLSVPNALNVYRSTERFRNEDFFTTLDICIIDLKDGIVDFYKAGAFDSFLVHKDRLTVIGGGGIPLVLSENDRVKHQSLRISNNDYLIMGSDGLAAFNEQTEASILLCKDSSIRIYAQNIFRRLSQVSNEDRNDDVTVIIAKFQKAVE
ncbi:MAG: SpoIIE family protein phosphatase [Firmicutes bacterium]|nr:SpoIIE family protein phosphatase [Bacillota bacterium]